MDDFDVVAADQGRVPSRPRARAQYDGTCYRCGGAIMVQDGWLGADLLVMDENEAWVHSDCF